MGRCGGATARMCSSAGVAEEGDLDSLEVYKSILLSAHELIGSST